MYYIGIDLGGTNIAVGIVDSDYKIIIKGSVPTKAQRAPELIIKDMANLCAKLVADAGLTFDDIEYAGIAAPGSVNPKTGTVIYSNNIPLNNFEISAILKSYIPLKAVYLDNDANAAALGEAVAGAARGVKHAIMITLGTGVGGGIIIDGKIYSGFNYTGAELGHTVIEKDGRQCTCGRKGCFEAYGSATALIKMTKEKLEECAGAGRETLMSAMVAADGKVSGKTAFAAMKKGDAAAKEVVDMYISYLGCGLVNMANIFQPEIIVIGGGICNEKEYLTAPLNEILKKEIFGGAYLTKAPTLKIADLGNDAGIIGAAVLGL